ncbi:MAG: DUF5985 family protein [Pseudomonadota bacterium]
MQMFMLGMISMGFAVAALFFLRFWRSSRDRLFLYFAVAFGLEAANRAAYAWNGAQSEEVTLYFSLRLLAFSLILWAIIDKNWIRRR